MFLFDNLLFMEKSFDEIEQILKKAAPRAVEKKESLKKEIEELLQNLKKEEKFSKELEKKSS